MQFENKPNLDFASQNSTIQKVSGFLENHSQSTPGISSYSSRLEQHQNPSLSVSQVKSELQSAIAQLFPYEQQQLTEKFCQGLPKQELDHLQLSSQNPPEMTLEDISEMITYAYCTHPHLFQEILAQQPRLIHLLSNHFVSAILGIMAAKWLNGSIKTMNIT